MITLETSLHFNLVIFEGISRHSYCSFGSCIVEGFMGDSITTIYDSACNSVFNTGMMRDPMTTIAINRTSLHKVRHVTSPHSTLHKYFAVGWSIWGLPPL